MISRRLILALISAAMLLTSCAAGGQAPTRNIKQVTDGVDKDAGEIKIRNLLIVSTGATTATLVAYIVNQGEESDEVIEIRLNGQKSEFSGAQPLLTNKPMIFEGEAANAKATVASLGAGPGNRVPVIITFAKAGKIQLDALIVENSGIYSSIL